MNTEIIVLHTCIVLHIFWVLASSSEEEENKVENNSNTIIIFYSIYYKLWSYLKFWNESNPGSFWRKCTNLAQTILKIFWVAAKYPSVWVACFMDGTSDTNLLCKMENTKEKSNFKNNFKEGQLFWIFFKCTFQPQYFTTTEKKFLKENLELFWTSFILPHPPIVPFAQPNPTLNGLFSYNLGVNGDFC